MVAKLVWTGMVVLGLGSLAGCEGCNPKPPPPATQHAPAPAGVRLVAVPTVTNASSS